MLRNLIAVGFVGLGCMASGCTVEAGDESIGSSREELSACDGAMGTRAALAIAMADELGRWDPLKDLVRVKEGSFTFTRLKPTAVCLKDNCKMTKAILGQQKFTADPNSFNPEGFRSTLDNSLSHQMTLLAYLSRQDPPLPPPPAHKLTKVSGEPGTGAACGARYLFQVDRPDGTPLTSTEAANMESVMCFFGKDFAIDEDSIPFFCGGSALMGVVQAQTGCPAGRKCIAVKAHFSDLGMWFGSSFPMNRLYNPNNQALGSACTMTSGTPRTMKSKCGVVPDTCGFLYCTP